MSSKLGSNIWDCPEKYEVQKNRKHIGSGYDCLVSKRLVGHVGIFQTWWKTP